MDKVNRAISHLETLIGFDTRNGTGDEIACVNFLKTALNAHKPDQIICETVSRLRGKSDSGYVMASWGRPRILLNVHIDTVPSGNGWNSDPLKLRQDGEHVIGLGAADIKGAAACILAALDEQAPKDVAILFSGDEEHGSEVMPEVIKRGHSSEAPLAIICEPTSCKVGRRHRGMLGFSFDFHGPGGHSSLADHMTAPLGEAAELASALRDYGKAHLDVGTAPYKGLCLNIGEMSCDGSYNVIPTRANLKMSLRPPPGDDIAAREVDIRKIANDIVPEAPIDRLVSLLSFATKNIADFDAYFGDEFEIIDLPFWTEAAMLSAAGKNAVVFGPGHIDQAHKPNEYVSRHDLAMAIPVYARALSGHM